MSAGREKVYAVKVSNPKNLDNSNQNNTNNELSPYEEPLRKLIKKFIFFFDIFKEI